MRVSKGLTRIRSVVPAHLPATPPPCPEKQGTVAVLDFTGITATGTGFRVTADGATSHPFAIGERLYDRLARDALRFFHLMRCGTSIDDPVYGRPAGHLGDRAVGMAFHRVHGTDWSPLPGRPHEDPTGRVLHRPSTTATLTWRPSPRTARACCAATTFRSRRGCSPPPARRTSRRDGIRPCWPPTTRAPSAAARTTTTISPRTSTGRRRSCGARPPTGRTAVT
jgi:hypothetical protein